VEAHKKVIIDTNLLVRYLTNDEPQKARAVENLLNSAEKGDLKIFIPSIVIAELIWVLESYYQLKSDKINDLIDAIIKTPGIEVADKKIIIPAMELYRENNIDFIDAWLISFAREMDFKTIYTFDKKHFKDIDDIVIKHP
jgi:predicted nucleic-acid-binding protein